MCVNQHSQLRWRTIRDGRAILSGHAQCTTGMKAAGDQNSRANMQSVNGRIEKKRMRHRPRRKDDIVVRHAKFSVIAFEAFKP